MQRQPFRVVVYYSLRGAVPFLALSPVYYERPVHALPVKNEKN